MANGELIKLSEDQMHPRDYDAPGSSAQTEGSGKGTIDKLAVGQIFNNSAQGTGVSGPSVWGGAAYTASKSSAEAGTKVAASYSVDLVSGQNSCWNGGNKY